MRSHFFRYTYFIFIIIISSILYNCTPSEDDGQIKIAGIVFQEDQFFRMIELGMEESAEERGVSLLTGNSSNSLDREISLIDSYIAGRVDAIVVSPLSMKASIPALKRANDSGIKVITYNTTLESDIPVCYIESDQYDLGASTGRAVREYINDNLDGKAKIAMIEFISQSPEQGGQRVDGFKSVIGDMDGVEIAAEQDAWLVQQAADVVEQLLTAHPDLDIIWAANEGGTVGAAIGVKNTGKTGEVVVFGTDMSEQLAGFLLSEDNILQAVTGQKPFDIGSLAVENAVKILNSETVDNKISLPGILFTRTKPDEISEYKERLKTLSK
ncbi:MAG: sugar ABC transporter substrate-binding protein [bacterium]|nr:sugar ABC transporter substrate-binding protein [bacterium]